MSSGAVTTAAAAANVCHDTKFWLCAESASAARLIIAQQSLKSAFCLFQSSVCSNHKTVTEITDRCAGQSKTGKQPKTPQNRWKKVQLVCCTFFNTKSILTHNLSLSDPIWPTKYNHTHTHWAQLFSWAVSSLSSRLMSVFAARRRANQPTVRAATCCHAVWFPRLRLCAELQRSRKHREETMEQQDSTNRPCRC